MRRLLAAPIILAMICLPVQAKTPLSQVTEINDGLFTIAIAAAIGENCPTIEPRKIRGLFALNSLHSKARSLGYSFGEISDYVNDRDEREKLRVRTFAWLGERGATESDPQSFCPIGRAEIEKSSGIGRLLK